jgi:hypothetical protein
MANHSNLSPYVLVAIIALVVVRITAGTNNKVPSNPAELEQWLVKQAMKTNAELPKMVNADTRLDSTKAGPGRQFTINYSLPELAETDIDLEVMLRHLRSEIKDATCKDAKPMLKAGVTMNLVYRSKDGAYLTRLAVRMADCG